MAIQQTKKQRPFGWRIVLLLYTLVAIQGLGRAWTAWQQQDRYNALENAPPLALYLFYDVVVGIVFLSLCFSILRYWRWGIRYGWYILSVAAMCDVGWQMIFIQNTYDRNRMPFVGFIWIVVLGMTWLITRRHSFQNIAIKES